MDRPLSQLIAPELIFERSEERPRCGKQRIVFLEAGEIQQGLSVQLVSRHAIPDALHCLRNGPPNHGAHLFELRPHRLRLRGNVVVHRLWSAWFHTRHSMVRDAVFPRRYPYGPPLSPAEPSTLPAYCSSSSSVAWNDVWGAPLGREVGYSL